jgi:hypothetical protein
MLTLPPVEPATGWRATTRLARDHYVRLEAWEQYERASHGRKQVRFSRGLRRRCWIACVEVTHSDRNGFHPTCTSWSASTPPSRTSCSPSCRQSQGATARLV